MTRSLFASSLKRTDLLSIPQKTASLKIKIAVYRNHSFEMTASVLNAFLNFSDISASFVYSDYDDSLNFQIINDADLSLIWVDIKRYKISNIATFLEDRVFFLAKQTKKPVLLAYTGKDINLSLSVADSYSFCIDNYLTTFGKEAYDEKKEAYSGTRLSNKSVLEISRVLGLKYIPAIFKTPLKALVLDLDNTLYKGILGEDGINALIPNVELQKQIKNLKEKGFFICLCSKNEQEDVQKLFEKRKDFILNWNDFTVAKINWNPKSENILKIAKSLNIGTDSILFIDDNPAEIENVKETGVKTLLAQENVADVLYWYPGLMKLRSNVEDDLRSKDVQANLIREKMLKKLSKEEYFQKLGIKLTYSVNDDAQVHRVTELFGKTNQFILNYKRYSEADVFAFMQQKNNCIITIQMSDNLSDSGIIAILAGHKEADDLFVDELTVSCRALGRNLEDIMLPELLRQASVFLKTRNIAHIFYKKGERNTPALVWLKNLVDHDLIDNGVVEYTIPQQVNLDGLTVIKQSKSLKLHHIGVATRSIENELKMFELLGYKAASDIFCDEIQKIKGIFIEAENNPRLELLENLSSDGPRSSCLQKGIKFYHLAYETTDIEKDVQAFVEKTKSIIIFPITKATYFEKVCFLMMRNMTVVEFVQIK